MPTALQLMGNLMSSVSIITIAVFASNIYENYTKKYSDSNSMVSAALLSILQMLFVYRTPKQLAWEAKYVPRFFELTKSDFHGFDGEMYVVDEFHSQGRKWGDFGNAHYEIRLCELHPNVRRDIEEKGGFNIDSTWLLTKVRGNIRGELVIKHNSPKAYARYYQIYDE